MNQSIILLLVTFLVSGYTAAQEKFRINRGTNIAHWLSQSEKRGKERINFFTESDIKRIAAMGCDHIRIPIDEEQMWDEAGNRHDEAFQLLENGIEWSISNNLKVIVDLHILRSHHFNEKEKPLWTDEKEQEKFFDLWRDLSSSLKDFPNHMVAYELMNEAVADDHEDWNKLLQKAFTAIREIEPERVIVIGSNRWQSVETFDALKVPKNDKNIILSFHFYKPFLFSHYKAPWTELKNFKGPVSYPGVILKQKEFRKLSNEDKITAKNWVGKNFDATVLENYLKQPLRKAKDLGLPLYCGEFGIYQTAPKKDKLAWYKDLISILEKHKIGYANWNYKSGGFGLVNDKEEPDEKVIEIISGKK